ncbi:MAG: malto-oligosyltrehalose synthase [Desulfobacteraceae bacterium]|nr:MAG: malto-oligosyltrehalose synthase [Desulfobacteraceae bacterium]
MNLPTATYRIQLHAGFGFRASADVLDYLQALGISHLYASPVFKARKGSAHGYDIEDPNQLNPELGDSADRDHLFERLKALGMGWIQDIVPNHMVYSGANPLLSDVLENGSRSPFYEFFDIQWDHPAPELHGAVSAPFLGQSLEACLEKGEIELVLTADGLQVGYYDQRFPLSLDAYPLVLCPGGSCALADIAVAADEEELRRKVERIVQSARLYDAQTRRLALTGAKRDLWDLYNGHARIKTMVEARLRRFRETPFEVGLDDLLGHQNFRLRHWTTAGRQINYRRFFDINELITLRQELPVVFDFTHQLIKQLVREGLISGLRVDHIDGLADPAGYLDRLRRNCGDIYIVAEKILGPDEPLAENWAVQGTTGYEFGAHMNALLCCPDHAAELTRLYARITASGDDFARISRRCKRKVLFDQFGGDLHNLVLKWEAAMQIGSEQLPPPREELQAALVEMLIGLPVYRTYLASSERAGDDRAVIQRVLAQAEALRPEWAPTFAAIGSWINEPSEPQASLTGKWITINKRQSALAAFEQLAAPLTAKGIEDTALYRYNRLAALNEVGADPERFGGSRRSFHRFAALRQEKWPHSLNALSTHDTKRSADVRARMLVIAELPREWADQFEQWRKCNAAHMVSSDGGAVPDPEMEYLLYQTLAATLPPDHSHLPEYGRRIASFLLKSAREAKQRTSWIAPDREYEQALLGFLEKILRPADNPFLDLIQPFAARIAHMGLFNALSQNLIHLTAPGIPDIYQGTELFDDSLVDPDNRRPVDFARRRRFLSEIEKGFRIAPLTLVQQLMAQRFDGRIKLFTTWIALQARRRYVALFRNGGYLPLSASGPKERHAMAFARVGQPHWSVTIVPRFPASLIGKAQEPLGPAVWADTAVILPQPAPKQWRNLMTGEPVQAVERLPLGQILKHLPVALLIGEGRP